MISTTRHTLVCGAVLALLAATAVGQAAFAPCGDLPLADCWATDFSAPLPTEWVQRLMPEEDALGTWNAQRGALFMTHRAGGNRSACGFRGGYQMLFVGSERVTRSNDFVLRVLLRVANASSVGATIGVVFDYVDDATQNRVALTAANPPTEQCRQVVNVTGGVAASVLSGAPADPARFGMEPGATYEILVERSWETSTTEPENREVKTVVTVVRYADADTQQLVDLRVLNGVLYDGAPFGVFCADSDSCVFERAIVTARGAPLSGPVDCAACSDPAVINAVGTQKWCRCCGEGGVGCAPFTRDACMRDNGFCEDRCAATQYCEFARPPTPPPTPAATASTTPAPTTTRTDSGGGGSNHTVPGVSTIPVGVTTTSRSSYTTSTSSSTTSQQSGYQTLDRPVLSTGEIVGIVIGSVLACIVLVLLVVMVLRCVHDDGVDSGRSQYLAAQRSARRSDSLRRQPSNRGAAPLAASGSVRRRSDGGRLSSQRSIRTSGGGGGGRRMRSSGGANAV